MPNNGRITLCPFYRDEKNLSISCEDTFRRFRWPAQKKAWLDEKCDKDWESCPYARELMELYDNMGECDMENKILKLEHEKKALEKELRKVSSLLGKASKREREKHEQIKVLQRKNSFLEERYIGMRERVADARRAEEAAAEYVGQQMATHQGIIAYLMANPHAGEFDCEDVVKWSQSHVYAIYKDEDGRFKVEVNEHTAGESASENEGTGSEKTDAAGNTCKGDPAEKVQERTL